MFHYLISFFLMSCTLYADDTTSPIHPCKADTVAHCKGDAAPTDRNRFYCLHFAYDSLNPTCQKFLNEKLSEDSCYQESMTLCKGVDRNSHRALECLKPQMGKLGEKCKKLIKKQVAIKGN